MKKPILTIALAFFAIGTIVTSCKSNTEKEIEAQENLDKAKAEVTEAHEDLREARKEATAEEWQEFKDSTNVKIDRNNQRIADLKLKIKKAGNDMDKTYQKSIDDMEQKNNELKVKMDNYKNDVNSDWNSFKREFNHDIDELGTSLKDFTVDNKK